MYTTHSVSYQPTKRTQNSGVAQLVALSLTIIGAPYQTVSFQALFVHAPHTRFHTHARTYTCTSHSKEKKEKKGSDKLYHCKRIFFGLLVVVVVGGRLYRTTLMVDVKKKDWGVLAFGSNKQ
jgi:hypothetical protein